MESFPGWLKDLSKTPELQATHKPKSLTCLMQRAESMPLGNVISNSFLSKMPPPQFVKRNGII